MYPARARGLPRELRHPHVFEAGVGHRSDIAFPLFARPMFGKVTDSETHSASSQPRHLSVPDELTPPPLIVELYLAVQAS